MIRDITQVTKTGDIDEANKLLNDNWRIISLNYQGTVDGRGLLVERNVIFVLGKSGPQVPMMMWTDTVTAKEAA